MTEAENRLVTNLEARARRAKEPGDKAEALCLIIIHYARQGHVDVARADLSMLRSNPAYIGSARAKVWMQLADGFIARVECEYGIALQAAQNAYNSCLEENLPAIRPACAAALADIAFAMSQVEAMVGRLEEVFRDADASDNHARSWACQAMAVASHYAAGFNTAKPWYDRLHRHATSEGDQATLSAMFHNITTMNLSKIRLSHAFGETDASSLERLRFEESTHRFYDQAVNVISQQGAMSLMKGQIRMLLGQNEKAVEILRAVDLKSLRFSDVPVLLADLATALSNIGAIHEAQGFADRSQKLSGNLNDPDDYAYVYARLSNVYEKLNDNEQSAAFRKKAKQQKESFAQTCVYWLSNLNRVERAYAERNVCM